MPEDIAQNWLVFRTNPGALTIPAGETVRLNKDLPCGIPVANFQTIRVYCRNRTTATVAAEFYIHVLDRENDELIFLLDSIHVEPGQTISRIFQVPGRELVVFAHALEGEGNAYIDFGVLGFGPMACHCP